ncbi:MAG: hypothetical protein J6S78_07690 [Lachnospiraceae bacterium]|nr:hypothetical protein [Lachnospiraceae bacterium]
MRDPKRIRSFCNRLAAAWEKVPDWRFGQFIVNLIRYMDRDPFFPEDREMIKIIEDFAEKFKTYEPPVEREKDVQVRPEEKKD